MAAKKQQLIFLDVFVDGAGKPTLNRFRKEIKEDKEVVVSNDLFKSPSGQLISQPMNRRSRRHLARANRLR